jgi:Kae1-associated kinase Bud32
MFTFMSFILMHPCSPLKTGKFILLNEGFSSRYELEKIGILTPKLLKIDQDTIVEEYVEGGDLYAYLKNSDNLSIVRQFGSITRTLHDNGACFIDNKAQNYLVRNSEIYRTDLGLMQDKVTEFTKSLDIGIFLASLLDLENAKYKKIEEQFLVGYTRNVKSNHNIPYLSIIIRNIAALVLAANHKNLAKNLLAKSDIH